MRPKVYVTRLIPKRGLELLCSFAEAKICEGELALPQEVLLAEAKQAEGLFSLLTDTIDAE